jgi:hypothetical protein
MSPKNCEGSLGSEVVVGCSVVVVLDGVPGGVESAVCKAVLQLVVSVRRKFGKSVWETYAAPLGAVDVDDSTNDEDEDCTRLLLVVGGTVAETDPMKRIKARIEKAKDDDDWRMHRFLCC